METKTKYQVVFYLNDIKEVENLIYGIVLPEHFNYQVKKRKEE